MTKYQIQEVIGGICAILCFFLYPIIFALIF